MEGRLKGRVAIISGGTGQLGRAVSLRFLAEGAAVLIPYYLEEEVRAFRQAHPREAADMRFDPVDATQPDSVRRYCETIAQAVGAPGVLINLAGGYSYGPTVETAEPADFTRLFELNVLTALNLCRGLLPAMLQAGGGKIVNVGARAGLEGSANHAAYSASKAALQRMTEALSAEVKERGINVNCVLPSIIDTPRNRQDLPDADFSRWVTPDALSAVIAFLASDDARAIHGAAIPVYGLM